MSFLNADFRLSCSERNPRYIGFEPIEKVMTMLLLEKPSFKPITGKLTFIFQHYSWSLSEEQRLFDHLSGRELLSHKNDGHIFPTKIL